MSATAIDLRRPATVVDELAAANAILAREPATPASVVGLVQDVADAIGRGDAPELADINPWVWIRAQAAALRAQSALRREDPQRRADLRLALEQLRFLLARLAEREPIGEERGADEVARWLDAALPSVSQPDKARLLGVSPRTFQRWISDQPSSPSAADERRLRIVARLVNQLRHSLTAPGVLDWFAHPRDDLGGAAPAGVLDDPGRLEALITAAAASRGSIAA